MQFKQNAGTFRNNSESGINMNSGHANKTSIEYK